MTTKRSTSTTTAPANGEPRKRNMKEYRISFMDDGKPETETLFAVVHRKPDAVAVRTALTALFAKVDHNDFSKPVVRVTVLQVFA